MNRRSILSSLCTAALALLAPVVALAKPHRKARLRNYGIRPMVITPVKWEGVPPLDLSDWEGGCGVADDAFREVLRLRALLAEAREVVARKPITFKQKDGTTRDYIIPLDTDADLLSRIDAVLKEKV